MAVIGQTTDSGTFIETSKALGELPVHADPNRIESALDLLKGPLAVGETREHILRYIGRLAGQAFTTTDDLLAWMRDNDRGLDPSRLPENPFRR